MGFYKIYFAVTADKLKSKFPDFPADNPSLYEAWRTLSPFKFYNLENLENLDPLILVFVKSGVTNLLKELELIEKYDIKDIVVHSSSLSQGELQ